MTLAGQRRCEKRGDGMGDSRGSSAARARAAAGSGAAAGQLQDRRQPRLGDRPRHDLAGRRPLRRLDPVQGEEGHGRGPRLHQGQLGGPRGRRELRRESRHWSPPVASSSASALLATLALRDPGRPRPAEAVRSTPPRSALRASPSASATATATASATGSSTAGARAAASSSAGSSTNARPGPRGATDAAG